MTSSGILRHGALVRTDVSEELKRVIRRNIPEGAILHCHRRENLKIDETSMCRAILVHLLPDK
jgi:hypothetical protein